MNVVRLLLGSVFLISSLMPSQAFEGLYRGSWDYGAVSLTIENLIQRSDLQKYRVTAIVRSSGCVGEMTGIGYAIANGMTVIAFDQEADPDRKCTLLLRKTSKGIAVKETEGCSGHHGVACGFGGNVTKR